MFVNMAQLNEYSALLVCNTEVGSVAHRNWNNGKGVIEVGTLDSEEGRPELRESRV